MALLKKIKSSLKLQLFKISKTSVIKEIFSESQLNNNFTGSINSKDVSSLCRPHLPESSKVKNTQLRESKFNKKTSMQKIRTIRKKIKISEN